MMGLAAVWRPSVPGRKLKKQSEHLKKSPEHKCRQDMGKRKQKFVFSKCT